MFNTDIDKKYKNRLNKFRKIIKPVKCGGIHHGISEQ
jgi:hypothetical protein